MYPSMLYQSKTILHKSHIVKWGYEAIHLETGCLKVCCLKKEVISEQKKAMGHFAPSGDFF